MTRMWFPTERSMIERFTFWEMVRIMAYAYGMSIRESYDLLKTDGVREDIQYLTNYLNHQGYHQCLDSVARMLARRGIVLPERRQCGRELYHVMPIPII